MLLSLAMVFSACSENAKNNLPFQKISPAHSGIDFTNTIVDNEDLNILNFHYIYNGGGVGVADFNKDGLEDLVFSGNQVDSKIYLNQGDFQFSDITEASGFISKAWATGISIVDINGDGWMDIYQSVGGSDCDGNCNNQLFIHQGLNENGTPKFKEQAKQYGLADGLYTQQTAFFDYDGDGDLDAYLLHNAIDKRDKNVPADKKFINKKSKDQLLQNNGNGQFIDVSESAGIIHKGYGLGITINDLNMDGLPDIYIANDFLSEDLIYINKGIKDGVHQGFEESASRLLKHQSYNAMGVDIADINEDARPDIFVVDMLPETNERQKTMLGFMNYNKFQLTIRQGYAPQFVRNTLQLHNGSLNDAQLPFSDIGHAAGVYNTDWSWTPLMADFDNDGDRDIYVTNGYGKDITDLDFINYSVSRPGFGTKASQQAELYAKIKAMQPITMPNYFFENKGTTNFTNQSKNWIDKENSLSNGAVYVDLDNDGDLDLVSNNIDQPAYILKNNLADSTAYLKVMLKGTVENPTGIGAKIYVTSTQKQAHYQSPVRGYLSSVSAIAHFGLGNSKEAVEVNVIWPDGKSQTLEAVTPNQTLTVDYQNAQYTSKNQKTKPNNLFVTTPNLLNYTHQENPWSDYDAQPLLLHQHSQQGPCMATADVNGIRGDEVFIGGAKGFASQLFTQNGQGEWEAIAFDDEAYEVTDAVFFDYNGDGHLDLYAVSGGTEQGAKQELYQDQLYINNGKGQFSKSDMLKAGSFPQHPKSQLIAQWTDGRMINYADKLAQGFVALGMVTDAVWSDYDNDGWEDLIVVGEGMPITMFKNKKGILAQPMRISNSAGLWNCIDAIDLNQDGLMDYVLGNQGTNTKLKASTTSPIVIYNKDYDNNGSIDPLIGMTMLDANDNKKLYPLHARDDVMKQIVKVKNRYRTYADFGKVTFDELLEHPDVSNDYLQITHLASSYLINQGDGAFELNALPNEFQIAPIRCVEGLGNGVALVVGNDYSGEKTNGWQDAMNGLVLTYHKGQIASQSAAESGFYVPGDARDIVQIIDRFAQKYTIVTQNKGALKCFKVNDTFFE